MKNTEKPVVVKQSFNASPESVWDAITKPNQMRQWYFDNISSFKPEVGFETQFDVQTEERNFPHIWKITEVEPLKKISYNWKYEGYLGDSYVTFELFEQDQSTTLILTHMVLEDFPDEIPEFRRESCLEGWNYFIQNSLKDYLDDTK